MDPTNYALLIKVISVVAESRKYLSRSVDDVVSDLRLIRFNDDGIVELIDKLIDGKRVDVKRASSLLKNFNDKEWQMKEALERLAADALNGVKKLSRLTRREIELIGWKKLEVRLDVQSEVNYFMQDGFKTNTKRLRELRTQIVKLNSAIDKAEHTLLHGGA